MPHREKTLQSNLPLPRIAFEENPPGDSDCELHLGMAPIADDDSARESLMYTSTFTDRFGQPALRLWKRNDERYLRMEYSDGHQFWLDCKGTEIWAVWPDSSSIEEVTSYLLGPVIGVVLRHRGAVCLHASAVTINGKAVAFVGPPGAGKSTMAAALSQRGSRVLADDITTIEERDGVFYVHPAYPGVCLWPDSIGLLYGSTGPKASPVANGDKRCLSANEGLRFESRSLPLGRIYILDSRTAGEPSYARETLHQNLFLSLVANTYASNILDIQMRAHEFAVLGRIASEIPVSKLYSRQSLGQLDSFCDLIPPAK